MKLLIKNIGQIVGATAQDCTVRKGADMAQLPCISNAWLAVEDGLIAEYGTMEDWPGIIDWRDLEVLDAEGKFLLPTWCDSHTHLVFAGSRATEFEDRIKGLTYQEIAARGGGILNSAAKLAQMSEDQLFEDAHRRLIALIHQGTGGVEIKSGYGLDLENELKILRVIRRLRDLNLIPIRSTFLGAHAFPTAYAGNKQGYVQYLIDEMLPEVAKQKLADFVDVFCEENYFSNADTDAILEAAAKYGLFPKIHVNQFTISGGIAVAIKHRALSVDHLEVLDSKEIMQLKNSTTIPVALPGCSFFIGIPYTPARQIIDAGLPLALATDFNPGSCPSGNMNFVASLACTQMKMLPLEAITAGTINGAWAMGLEHELGSIAIGKRANFMITKSIQSLAELPYYFGETMLEAIYIDGKKM
jgi:imidazolonepropionase